MEKIPKFQNSKIPKFQNVYTKILGVMLFLSIMFAGCKRKDVLPTPEASAEAQKAMAVAKAKQWFLAQKHNKNIPDSLLALREPDWQNASYYSMMQGGVSVPFLEMPLLYGGKYQTCKQTYADGTKGRGYTKIVLKQINETDFLPVVMRFYADSVYLTQPHPPLANNLYGSFDANFKGEAHFYSWAKEQFIGGNKFAQGTLTHTTQNARREKDYVCVDVTTILSGSFIPGSTVTLVTTTVCWYTTDQGSGGSGGSGMSGGYGFSGGVLGVNPFDNPNDPNAEPFRKISLDSAFQNHQKMMCIYDRVKKMIEEGDASANNNLFWRLSLPFSGANDLRLKLDLVDESKMETGDDGETDPDGIPNGFVTIRINKQIMENSSDLNTANTILHEMMHAYYFGIIHKMGGVSALLAYTGNQEPYLSLKQYYQQYEWKKAQHNVMANNTYRGFMKKALKAFMGSNQLSDWRYEGMSWAGLWMTDAWINLQESTKRTNTVAFRASVKKDASNKSQCD